VVLAALIAAAWAVGSIVDGFLAGTFGQIVRILLVATFFAQRSTFDHARSALASMDSGDNASSDDVHAKHRGITRELASRFGDSIVLPALMYAVFNLPGLFAYGVAMIAANRWPPQDAFAALLRRIMHMANLIAGAPAALIIIVASTFCPGGSPWRAFGVTWRSPSPLPDGQPSWPLAALAGALNLSFEGKSSWIGNGRARLTAHDVRSTFYLFVIACLLHLIIWAIFGVLLVG
jgi:adenosylcobinamide-phosphate synthase